MKVWTEAAEEQARVEGWRMAETIDAGTTHVYLRITPIDGRFKNSYEAATFVIKCARTGSRMHQDAMSISVSSRIQPTTTKRK